MEVGGSRQLCLETEGLKIGGLCWLSSVAKDEDLVCHNSSQEDIDLTAEVPLWWRKTILRGSILLLAWVGKRWG